MGRETALAFLPIGDGSISGTYSYKVLLVSILFLSNPKRSVGRLVKLCTQSQKLLLSFL